MKYIDVITLHIKILDKMYNALLYCNQDKEKLPIQTLGKDKELSILRYLRAKLV